MSIFSFVGKVLKAGASVVTHGLSDKVLSVLKGSGKPTKNIAPTIGAQAIVHKVRQASSTKTPPTAVLKKATKMGRSAATKIDKLISYSPKMSQTETRAKKKSKKTSAPKSKGTRKAPSGGLDLKKIAQMWRAEGKPGTWLNYIKAHSNIRKAA